MPSRSKSVSGHKDERLDLIARRARGVKTDGRLPFSRSELIKVYFADVADEDLDDRDPTAMAAAALSHLTWALERKRGTAKIRVFNPDTTRDGWSCERTVVQLVNDNMPFLVDSVTMALDRLGHGIHVTIHPLLRVARTPKGRLRDMRAAKSNGQDFVESYIHIEIRRETNREVLKAIESALRETLRDVRAAVEDWQPMLSELRTACAELRENAPTSKGLLDESCRFLEWLADDNFTLLGYHEFRLLNGERADRLRPIKGTGLGILRDPPDPGTQEIASSAEARRVIRSKNPLVITKSSSFSTIHRTGYLDQIDIKMFGRDGKPRAEKRFVGLFTSIAYSENPRDIPLLRLKIERVLRASGLDPKSHRGKALQHILDTFPRDDLFQISVSDLTRIGTEVRQLQGRRRVKLFCRRDVFGRFHSCLVYMPRDQYNMRARKRVETLLMDAFKGESLESDLTLSESALARLEFTIHSKAPQLNNKRLVALEASIAAALETWEDRLRTALLERLDEDDALRLLGRFGGGFQVAYQDEIDAGRAAEDVQRIAALADGETEMEMALHRPPTETDGRLRFSACRPTRPIKLYTALPILENMSLKVISEHVYRVDAESSSFWIQDFEVEPAGDETVDPKAVEARLLECFRSVLEGRAENDGFNSFVLTAGLHWREVTILRACCKYLLQTSINFSQSYMQEVLADHPQLARTFIEYFQSLFDPDLGKAARTKLRAASQKRIAEELEGVINLDQDRILRGFLSIINATLRTNFYHDKPYVSFKLDPGQVAELPEPRPKYEVFVYSPRMEGVHLRCGSVARGGLRWSDRREDYRTEILGLMKAQMVKNTVIVPTGAKGGFICKQLPTSDRDAFRAEGVACYRTFIRGFLDITDNIVGTQIVGPERVVRRDGDDPYLVVAADKGTATFSDIANEIAGEYGFWLGDAFASGGSAGYDHKKMGITARGAWEGVKRHFRELGMDIQNQSFTVVGIGDMAGDVFGNGMLLSKHIKLLAAFNHAHIFIDPDPTPDTSYRERQRLFKLPHSSWTDYDESKLSEGGGIYSRESKAIELHPRAQALLNLSQAKTTPPELIKHILRVKSDLLWNGGIGTYVKASTESHLDAGDPTNDAVRIDGKELGCRVVGEGGNLGLTQMGRIEFALMGGLINTDFIDNSGGVDSSDREVNIKILLNMAIDAGKLARSRRDELLAKMTDEVAEQVLENNYAQTQALSMMSARSHERLGESARLIKALESKGLLDRALEHLPSEEEIETRRKAGQGLTRPELAVILSYSKIDLCASLVETDIPEDAYLARDLHLYFPERLRQRFATTIPDHRLCRDIIAMRIASSMVNRMGPAFAARAQEDTGSEIAQIARAYAIAREVFDARALWKRIEALDNQVQAEVQYLLMFQISRMLRRSVYWFLHRHPADLRVEPMVERLRPGVGEVLENLAELESERGKRRLEKDIQHLLALGVDQQLAGRIAAMAYMLKALDIVEIAALQGLEPGVVARLYFQLGRGLRFDWLRASIEKLNVRGRWQAMARGTLRENVARQQRALLERVLEKRGKHSPEDALVEWLSAAKSDISRVHQTLEDMRDTGSLDFATLSVAIKEIERLI